VQPRPYIEFTLRSSFVFTYYLFDTTCFGLNGHHRVYTIVYENCCSAVTMLYFTFYKQCKMLHKNRYGKGITPVHYTFSSFQYNTGKRTRICNIQETHSNRYHNISIRNVIPSRMQLLLSLLPLTTCFGRKRPSSGVSVMPNLFHCPLIHITCNCDIT
jgi:hypothetical protein